MNCGTHSSNPAVYKCDNCGEPICKSCYNVFETPNGDHWCLDCYREALEDESDIVVQLKHMVKKEIILIIIGLVVGIIIDLCSILSTLEKGIHPYLFFLSIYLPFITGSFVTIIRKIKYTYLANHDVSEYYLQKDTSFNAGLLVALIIFYIIFSPIVTIVRLFQRIGDSKKLKHMDEFYQMLLDYIDDFADNEYETEMNIDATNETLCENSDVLRAIIKR